MLNIKISQPTIHFRTVKALAKIQEKGGQFTYNDLAYIFDEFIDSYEKARNQLDLCIDLGLLEAAPRENVTEAEIAKMDEKYKKNPFYGLPDIANTAADATFAAVTDTLAAAVEKKDAMEQVHKLRDTVEELVAAVYYTVDRDNIVAKMRSNPKLLEAKYFLSTMGTELLTSGSVNIKFTQPV